MRAFFIHVHSADHYCLAVLGAFNSYPNLSICIVLSANPPPTKMSSPLRQGPCCLPLRCNWEQLCVEVTIVHTEWFLEEGLCYVQSTIYPNGDKPLCLQVNSFRRLEVCAGVTFSQSLFSYCTRDWQLVSRVMWCSAEVTAGIEAKWNLTSAH